MKRDITTVEFICDAYGCGASERVTGYKPELPAGWLSKEEHGFGMTNYSKQCIYCPRCAAEKK